MTKQDDVNLNTANPLTMRAASNGSSGRLIYEDADTNFLNLARWAGTWGPRDSPTDTLTGITGRIWALDLNLLSWQAFTGDGNWVSANNIQSIVNGSTEVVPKFGSVSVKCVATAISPSIAMVNSGSYVAAVEGDVITFSAWVQSSTGKQCRIGVSFYNDADGWLMGTYSAPVTTDGTWQFHTVVATAPAGSATARVRTRMDSPAAGDAWFTNKCSVVAGSATQTDSIVKLTGGSPVGTGLGGFTLD